MDINNILEQLRLPQTTEKTEYYQDMLFDNALPQTLIEVLNNRQENNNLIGNVAIVVCRYELKPELVVKRREVLCKLAYHKDSFIRYSIVDALDMLFITDKSREIIKALYALANDPILTIRENANDVLNDY